MDEEPYQKLIAAAISFISFRLRSEKEIRQYLQKKRMMIHADEGVVEAVIVRLRELGYIDDRKFTEAFVFSQNQFRPKGKLVTRSKLREKGVPDSVIIEILSQMDKDAGQGGMDLALARKAGEKRLGSLKQYPLRERRNKLYSFLARKGFSHEAVSRVVDELVPDAIQ